ncbi:MAG: hypothetical protein JXB03_03580 [Spirochaetales bacterium]|nr:hypothetical protein [Spirochaetales bacterium]
MMRNIILSGLIVVAGLLSGCTTVPKSIDENLSINEYFQKAQEAVVQRNDYDTALLYYQTFKERFPEEKGRIVEADYEIAFIYYKKEQFDQAETLFRDIIARYELPEAQDYYQWPKVLSEKLLVTIEEKRPILSE